MSSSGCIHVGSLFSSERQVSSWNSWCWCHTTPASVVMSPIQISWAQNSSVSGSTALWEVALCGICMSCWGFSSTAVHDRYHSPNLTDVTWSFKNTVAQCLHYRLCKLLSHSLFWHRCYCQPFKWCWSFFSSTVIVTLLFQQHCDM